MFRVASYIVFYVYRNPMTGNDWHWNRSKTILQIFVHMPDRFRNYCCIINNNDFAAAVAFLVSLARILAVAIEKNPIFYALQISQFLALVVVARGVFLLLQ